MLLLRQCSWYFVRLFLFLHFLLFFLLFVEELSALYRIVLNKCSKIKPNFFLRFFLLRNSQLIHFSYAFLDKFVWFLWLDDGGHGCGRNWHDRWLGFVGCFGWFCRLWLLARLFGLWWPPIFEWFACLITKFFIFFLFSDGRQRSSKMFESGLFIQLFNMPAEILLLYSTFAAERIAFAKRSTEIAFTLQCKFGLSCSSWLWSCGQLGPLLHLEKGYLLWKYKRKQMSSWIF